jgi:RNA polymerase sigma-70 factor (ECF subfamily)
MVASGTDEVGQLVKLGKKTESFDSWYAREHPRLVATLLLTTGDIELATDSVDEAFTRALEKWNRVSAMESPTGWAFQVAINHARRTARRRAFEHRLLFKRAKEVSVPAPAGEIWQVVSALPPRQREVVVLRHIGDLREAEIAQVLGISRSTVSSTLSEAHHRLGHLLDDDPPTEERHHV